MLCLPTCFVGRSVTGCVSLVVVLGEVSQPRLSACLLQEVSQAITSACCVWRALGVSGYIAGCFGARLPACFVA